MVEVHRNSKTWMVIFAQPEGRKDFAENTLTAACMAAIKERDRLNQEAK